jgi:hypothetical protein
MVVTFIAMKILGQSFNLMTLGGLAAAVGLAIDDKIVVVENIVLHRDQGQGSDRGNGECLEGAHDSTDRIHSDTDRRLSSPDHDHRSNRNLLQRAGDRDDGFVTRITRSCAGLDEQPQHAADSPSENQSDST